MDFHSIWQRAKHGSVSEQEIGAAEAALRSEDMSDRHVPILIVGLMQKPDPSRIALVEAFLRSGKVDAERYSALRAATAFAATGTGLELLTRIIATRRTRT
jgi:hypothetical protein